MRRGEQPADLRTVRGAFRACGEPREIAGVGSGDLEQRPADVTAERAPISCVGRRQETEISRAPRLARLGAAEGLARVTIGRRSRGTVYARGGAPCGSAPGSPTAHGRSAAPDPVLVVPRPPALRVPEDAPGGVDLRHPALGIGMGRHVRVMPPGERAICAGDDGVVRGRVDAKHAVWIAFCSHPGSRCTAPGASAGRIAGRRRSRTDHTRAISGDGYDPHHERHRPPSPVRLG